LAGNIPQRKKRRNKGRKLLRLCTSLLPAKMGRKKRAP